MDEYQIKFLIIRFSSIGDIVLTTPVVRCLKEQVGGAVIHYLTKPQYADMLESNPYIDKVHTLKFFNQTVEELELEDFDYIIDLHKSLRSIKLKNKLEIIDFTFPKLNWEKWLLVNLKINILPHKHIVSRYFEAVKLFEVKNDRKGLDYFIEEKDKIDITGFFPEIKDKFIAFAIGGQHFTKKLPNNKIIEICNLLKSPVILLGGKEDFDNGEEIMSGTKNTYNSCGKFNLSQSASIIDSSRLVITHDTGLMHIASSLKKDIISVWGNTVPAFGMYPYLPGKNSVMMEVDNLKCRPCSKIGFKKCPKKHFNCMNHQDSAKIAEISEKIMSI